MANSPLTPQTLFPTEVQGGAGGGGLFGGGINPTAVQWQAQQQQRYNQVTGLANLLNWASTSGVLGKDAAAIAGGQYLRFLGEKDPYKALPNYAKWLQETLEAHKIGTDAANSQQNPNIIQPGPQPPPGAPYGAARALNAPTAQSQLPGTPSPPPGSGAAALPATPNGQVGANPQAGSTGLPTTVNPSQFPPQQLSTVTPPPGSNMPAGGSLFSIGYEDVAARQSNLTSMIALAQARAQAAGRQQEIADRAKMVESDPNLQGLAPFQKASIIYGQYMPVPMRPMGGDIMSASQAASQGITDISGKPIDPNSKDFYRTLQTVLPNGEWGMVGIPTVPTSSTTFTTETPDPNNSGGFTKNVVPRSGGAPLASSSNIVPSMATTKTTKGTPINIGGSTVITPITSTVQKSLPGQTPASPPSNPRTGSTAGNSSQGLIHTLNPEQVNETEKPMFDAENRLLTMSGSLTTALNGYNTGHRDPQAELNLLAMHMGMTTGAVTGMKTGRDIINEAEQSAPMLGRIEARFSPQGYITGVVLTPEQMQQMYNLGVAKYLVTRQQSRERLGAAGTNTSFPSIPPNVLASIGIPKSAMNPPPGKSLIISLKSGKAGTVDSSILPNKDYIEVK